MSHTYPPEQIDELMGWSIGTAKRLARRGELPHAVLPDGAIRFDADEILALVHLVPAKPSAPKGGGA